ncbi:MAG TPA: hypothetical protein VM299_00675 [Solirubrobacteraceae bacterium]|nr:hypothetical protein [Solirubrobacteraceae bacterium]
MTHTIIRQRLAALDRHALEAAVALALSPSARDARPPRCTAIRRRGSSDQRSRSLE